jgi:hypothetical protein
VRRVQRAPWSGRALLVAVTASVLVAAATFVFGSAARADSPSSQGWWTSANPGNVGGVGAPAAPPAPPDVPSNGLLVEGGPTSASGAGDTGATAYAALVYDVPDGATVSNLTLAVAPNSASTPSTSLELCPLTTQDFQPEEGGPMSDAPSYNCTNNVTAAQSSNSYQFNVSSLVASGTLAVAILPTSPPDRVVLSQPDTKSLQVQEPSDTTSGSPSDTGSSSGVFGSTAGTDTGSAIGAPSGTPTDTGGSSSSLSGVAATPVSSAAVIPALAVPSAAPPGSTPASSQPQANTELSAAAAPSAGPKPWVGLLFLLLLLVVAALWKGAGRSAAGNLPLPARDRTD